MNMNQCHVRISSTGMRTVPTNSGSTHCNGGGEEGEVEEEEGEVEEGGGGKAQNPELNPYK